MGCFLLKDRNLLFSGAIIANFCYGCVNHFSSGPDRSGAAYTGDWVNVNELEYIQKITIRELEDDYVGISLPEGRDRFVFELKFADSSEISAPAVYICEDDYFFVRMPNVNATVSFDHETGCFNFVGHYFKKTR